MKKKYILIFGAVMAFALQATAQIEKGTFFVGMSSAYSVPMKESNFLSLGYVRQTRYDYFSTGENITETWSFNVLPKVGYFVAKSLAVGLNGGFTYSSTTYSRSIDNSNNRNFGVGPFLRYYVKAKKVVPVVEVGLDYWKQHYYSQYESNDPLYAPSTYESVGDSYYLCYNIGAGIAVPIAQKASFDLLLTYSALRGESSHHNFNGEQTSDVSTSVISLRFGFVFFLSKTAAANDVITN